MKKNVIHGSYLQIKDHFIALLLVSDDTKISSPGNLLIIFPRIMPTTGISHSISSHQLHFHIKDRNFHPDLFDYLLLHAVIG